MNYWSILLRSISVYLRKRSVSSILWVLSWFLRRILQINLKLSDCCYTSNFESQTSSLSDDVMILTNFILLQIMMTTTYDMIYLIFNWYLYFLRIQLQKVTNIVDFIITFFFLMSWRKYRDFVFVIIVREEDNLSIIIQMKKYYIVVLWSILNLEKLNKRLRWFEKHYSKKNRFFQCSSRSLLQFMYEHKNDVVSRWSAVTSTRWHL